MAMSMGQTVASVCHPRRQSARAEITASATCSDGKQLAGVSARWRSRHARPVMPSAPGATRGTVVGHAMKNGAARTVATSSA